MTIRIVPTSERPDLAAIVAWWLWNEWARAAGRTYTQVLDRATRVAMTRPPLSTQFVLLQDGEPLGTASLYPTDLPGRPDLTPWLAGVFVEPPARGQGHAIRLVAAVEAEARAQSVATLWLYTHTAERLYARLGWTRVETVVEGGKDHALMRRDLGGADA